MEAGQMMSWDELAEENRLLKQQREWLMKSLADILPTDGGEDGQPWSVSVVERVRMLSDRVSDETRTRKVHEAKRLAAEEVLKGSQEARLATEKKLAEVQEAGIQTRQAAGVAVAMATLRSARAREFMEPDNLAKVWYDKYREDVLRTSAALNTRPTYPPASTIMDTWETLPAGSRTEIVGIAREVFKVFTDTDEAEGQKLDAVTESVMAEGNELATAVTRLQAVSEVLRHVWSAGILPGIRALSAAGIEVLPPGTIIHGVRPSNRVHRPE